jgi:hypothetical protein
MQWFSGRAVGNETAEPDAIDPPPPLSVNDLVARWNTGIVE